MWLGWLLLIFVRPSAHPPTTRRTWSPMCPPHFLPFFFSLRGETFTSPWRETAKTSSLSGVAAPPILPLLLIEQFYWLSRFHRLPGCHPWNVHLILQAWVACSEDDKLPKVLSPIWESLNGLRSKLIVQGLSSMRVHWLCAVKGAISTTETSTWVVKEGEEMVSMLAFFPFSACLNGEQGEDDSNCQWKEPPPPQKGRANLVSVETHRVVSSAPWSFSFALVVTLFFQEQLIRFSCPRSELVKDAPLWNCLTGFHETPNLLRIWLWATFYRMMSKASFFSQRHTAS